MDTFPEHRPGRLRIRARVRAHPLDAELAAGINPTRDPCLGLRAEQITQAGARRRLARGIRGAVEQSHQPFLRPTSAAPLDRRAIRSCQVQLLTLARMIETAPRPRARGVAIVRRLLLDGASPLYGGFGRGGGATRLESFVHSAINALMVSPDL